MSSNFTSFFETGYMIRAEGHKPFQSNYVTVYSRVAQDAEGADTAAGCQMFGKFDWAKHIDSNRWSASQQVYNASDRPHRSVQHRKLKVRGSGPALNLRFESEAGKPFHIVGWSTFDTAKQNV